MNIEHARTIPITLILDKLNFAPQRTKNKQAYYFSPLARKKKPGFSVDTEKNLWYDHGLKTGGDIIDLAVAILEAAGVGHAVSDALRYIENISEYVPMIQPVRPTCFIQQDRTLALKDAMPVKNMALIHYAERRGIPDTITREYLKEAVLFNKNSKKLFYALCIRNEDGGHELCNQVFKGRVGKPGVTFVRGTVPKPPGINIFHGLFDFLSVITERKGEKLQDDAIILHSLTHMRAGAAYIRHYGYRTAYTWMNNTEAGARAQIVGRFLRHGKRPGAHADE